VKTFAYITGVLILAIGLNILLGWPFWIIIVVIGIGAGLRFLRITGNAWTVPIAVVVAIFIIGTLTFQFLTGRLPLTNSFSNHIWLGHDVGIAAKAVEPAVKAKATALTSQVAYEDAGATKIAEYYEKGQPKEAINYLRELVAEGTELRSVVGSGGTQPPISQPAQAPAPAPMAMPPAQVAAAASAPPDQWIKMAGKYHVCLGGACNEFDLWKNGQSVTSEATFPYNQGKLEFEAREISPGKLSGSLKQIGHPQAKNEKWSFENISCSDISCSGRYTDEKGRGGDIAIDKMS